MLIIDMPMPKNCRECIFLTDCSFCEGYNDHCLLNNGNDEIGFKNGKEYSYWDFSCEIIPKERPSWCPIVGVLPDEPTVDAVPVVRCKECRWRHDDSSPMWLPCMERKTPDDWFCADGERKEKEND